jgi:hypothetical protein
MSKEFSRGQTQVLFRHLPGAIFEHDDYGLCKVTEVTLDVVDVNTEALFNAMADLMAAWREPSFINKFPDPRNPENRSRYSVGLPRDVRFEPYPATFECRKCHRAAIFDDMVRRNATNSGDCKYCGGSITRMRYVQAHNCGRLEQVYIPKKCPHCNSEDDIAFQDPGRVKLARWFCKNCNKDVAGMRMTPCLCAYSESIEASGFSPEKSLKVVPTGDPSLYVSHTVSFINFPDETAAYIQNAVDGSALVLARVWGLVPEPVDKLLRERAEASRSAGDSREAALANALRAVDPNHPMVKEYDARFGEKKGESAISRVKTLLQARGCAIDVAARRWALEHVTLLDRTSLTTVADVAAMLRRRGDESGAIAITSAESKAGEALGIRSMTVINDFPLTLAAFGYTRLSRDPARTVLNPFPANERGRFPVYAITSETEALWFELDPVAVVNWLYSNGLLAATAATREEAWAVLYCVVPGLRQTPIEPNYHDKAPVAARTLLHTISHVFLRRVEWSGFSPSSVGEYLIPGSLSFILYANRHAETKIGGLTTLFEQRLSTWLWDAVQAGRECIYDPICADDGGSCAGCTYREHNCTAFNKELSRSTLYGGSVPQSSEISGLTISKGFWDSAWDAAPKS